MLNMKGTLNDYFIENRTFNAAFSFCFYGLLKTLHSLQIIVNMKRVSRHSRDRLHRINMQNASHYGNNTHMHARQMIAVHGLNVVRAK